MWKFNFENVIGIASLNFLHISLTASDEWYLEVCRFMNNIFRDLRRYYQHIGGPSSKIDSTLNKMTCGYT